MTWVKVCGLRTPDDVDAAGEAGADAIGLVLADSPRKITAGEARKLAARAEIPAFLVVVDVRPAELLDLASYVGAAGVQPHGAHAAEASAAARLAGLDVLRPVRVAGPVDLSGIPDDQVPLLDTAVDGLHGGTGVTFDPSLAAGIERRWVMAGGLGPGTVGEAIRRLRPWGVDASSGLESAPGVKDRELILTFVEEAKSA